jgi:NAD(P)-dependent dehydrogenase (short-subunit alcohol dehydrogenase family)
VGERQSTLEDLVMRSQPNPDPSFWAGKRVLLTGHTGFKGAWLALWLDRLGAKVVGIGLPPATTPSLAQLAEIERLVDSRIIDIRDADELTRQIRSVSPGIVLHLAAQALVRTAYNEPLLTFGTNVQGTANLLEAVRATDTVRVVVAVTTDKVYRNTEQFYPYREMDALGGHDPYSASKAAAEMVIASYRDAYFASHGVAVGSARAGNVIGGGDWSEDRLIRMRFAPGVRVSLSPSAVRRGFGRGNTCLNHWRAILCSPSGYGPSPSLLAPIISAPRRRRPPVFATWCYWRTDHMAAARWFGAMARKGRMKRAGSRSKPQRLCIC